MLLTQETKHFGVVRAVLNNKTQNQGALAMKSLFITILIMQMLKIFLNSCFLVLFIISCNSQTNIDKNKGRVNASTETKITYIKAEVRKSSFFYTDSFGKGNNFSFSPINILKLSAPIFLFQTDELHTPFIIFPGDSLFLQENGNDITITSFSDPNRTKELFF
jgi:hypothetical protein